MAIVGVKKLGLEIRADIVLPVVIFITELLRYTSKEEVLWL